MTKRIYLDYNATSLIDEEVANLMIKMLLSESSYNPSSIHEDGRKARGIMENARQQIAQSLLIDLHKDDIQIIFTGSGTETNNLVLNNFCQLKLFISAVEHVSILEAGRNDKIIIEVDQDGLINSQKFHNLLKTNPGPKLVSVMLANNETGVIQDIKTLCTIAKQEQAIFHCDASQAFGKISINFKDLGCDMITISSHKCGGPSGAAALVAKKSINLSSQIKGGKQEQGLRAGTENLLAIAGFGLASKLSLAKFQATSELRDYLEHKILSLTSDARFFGNRAKRLPNTSSIRMPKVKSEEQLIKFDLNGISVSAGSACSSGRIASSHVLKAMKIDEELAGETIRVSLGPKTSKNDIDKFIQCWQEIYIRGH
jgi:cysteine desulfurase